MKVLITAVMIAAATLFGFGSVATAQAAPKLCELHEDHDTPPSAHQPGGRYIAACNTMNGNGGPPDEDGDGRPDYSDRDADGNGVNDDDE